MSALKICPQCGTEYELDQRFCPKDGSTLRLQDETGDLVGSIVADRYHVLRKLGEGGMGQVYLAEHVKMGRKSALKVMNPGMVKDADAISRFNREAANASRINHANVAAVYDFGETGEGLIYLAMEFVDGPSLTKLIEQQGALPPLRAADITRQAADALAVAHDMGIVHRDLKPDNIMIARNRDGSDCVKVVDFGIAKAADNAAQKVTKTGLVVGTPEYMSPEQLAGDKLDGRSDIYSLALVAFNMFTGRLPFPAETVQESMIMRLTDRPKSLSEMRPMVSWPAEVQAVLDRALQRDANLRYQNAAEFGRDLYRAVERMPASAVAEMGTQVIAPLPATRVAAAAAAGGATMLTGAAPAPAAPAPVPPTASAPAPAAMDAAPGAGVGSLAPPRANRMPLVAVGAVILIAAAAGGFVVTRGSGKSAADATAVTPSGQPTSPQQSAGGAVAPPPVATPGPATPAPGTGGAPATRNASSRASVPSSTRPTSKSPAPVASTGAAGSAASSSSVDAELDAIEKLADIEHGTQAAADRAIARLDALVGRLSGDQVVRAALARASAEVIKNNSTAACEAIRRVETLSKDTKYEKRVRFVIDQSC